jgi:hypothetical protein
LITLIPPVDRSAEIVGFSQTLTGRLVLVGVFAVGLILHVRDWWLEASLILLAMTLLPEYRRLVLLVATLAWALYLSPFRWSVVTDLARDNGVLASLDWPLFQAVVIVAALSFCAAFYSLALRYRETPFMRRPLRALLLTYLGLLALASWLPLPPLAQVAAWALLVVLSQYLWFLAYSLLDVSAADRSPFVLQLGHYFPFWMGTFARPVPVAKGAAYLRKIEAKTPEELAITQLKGIKLLYWAVILRAARDLYQGVVYRGSITFGDWSYALPFTLDIPRFAEVFQLSVAGSPAPWYVNWEALVARFVLSLLNIAIWGHLAIAMCRMAGFRALRNTYRPLRSATIAEFWNRYYYYFKELMVECFFYPAYLRYFKGRPRVRMFFATMAAACFGNVLFHFFWEIEYIVQMGLWDAFLAFRVYMFYGLFLGLAIGLSQVRHHGRRIERDTLRTRVLAPLSVLTFYCVLSIFDVPDRTIPATEYFRFALHLLPGL